MVVNGEKYDYFGIDSETGVIYTIKLVDTTTFQLFVYDKVELNSGQCKLEEGLTWNY